MLWEFQDQVVYVQQVWEVEEGLQMAQGVNCKVGGGGRDLLNKTHKNPPQGVLINWMISWMILCKVLRFHISWNLIELLYDIKI